MSEIPEPLSAAYTQQVMCEIMGITPRRIQQLAKQGILRRDSKGKFPFAPTISDYLDFLRGHAANANQAIDFNVEKARKTKAEADIAEIAAAKAKGEVVDLRDVERNLEFVFAEVKSNIRNVPQRVAPRIIGETEEYRIKEAILDELDQAMDSMADGIDWESAAEEPEDAEIEVQ